MNTCVFCTTTDNLNTEMTVKLDDGKKVTVFICDEHAEEATAKSVKEAYGKKSDMIKSLIEQAQALGLDISQIIKEETISQKPSGLLIANTPKKEVEPPPQKEPEAKSFHVPDDDDMIPTDRADNILSRPVRSVGGSTNMGSVQSYNSFEITGQQDKLSPELRKGKAKMAIAEGRGGQPIIIPRKRVDGTGTTNIIINNSESDRTLQDRFKKLADKSMRDEMPDYVHGGYGEVTRDCPICKGNGEVRGQECPKCHGVGYIVC